MAAMLWELVLGCFCASELGVSGVVAVSCVQPWCVARLAENEKSPSPIRRILVVRSSGSGIRACFRGLEVVSGFLAAWLLELGSWLSFDFVLLGVILCFVLFSTLPGFLPRVCFVFTVFDLPPDARRAFAIAS